LLGLALVLVFAVTRIIFVPQGEFVTYGALTLAMLDAGKTPGTAWLGLCFGVLATACDVWGARRELSPRVLGDSLLRTTLVPVLAALAAYYLAPTKPDAWLSVLITLAIIVPMGPNLYRIAFRPLAESSVLTMFIAAIGAHFAMTGLGLVFFGAEGLRARPLSSLTLPIGPLIVTGQILYVYAVTLVCIVGLALFFGRTLAGKALVATAMNRVGARLVGVRTEVAGRLSFALAALIGALSGILIAPMTTVFYDTGFLIGLKGFIAAIIGALASYPLTALAALAVGVIEAFASFFASNYKEVVVFTLIIPVLLWLSLSHGHADAEDES
jgi:branched-chain amino acid transport system permease protein